MLRDKFQGLSVFSFIRTKRTPLHVILEELFHSGQNWIVGSNLKLIRQRKIIAMTGYTPKLQVQSPQGSQLCWSSWTQILTENQSSVSKKKPRRDLQYTGCSHFCTLRDFGCNWKSWAPKTKMGLGKIRHQKDLQPGRLPKCPFDFCSKCCYNTPWHLAYLTF